jgi:hypothetical protein
MELIGDVGQMEACFSLFGYSVNLDATYVHSLRRTYYRLRNRIGRTRWYSYVMWAKWKFILVRLEIVLVSTQDRCTVCTKHAIGSEIILGAPDGTPG